MFPFPDSPQPSVKESMKPAPVLAEAIFKNNFTVSFLHNMIRAERLPNPIMSGIQGAFGGRGSAFSRIASGELPSPTNMRFGFQAIRQGGDAILGGGYQVGDVEAEKTKAIRENRVDPKLADALTEEASGLMSDYSRQSKASVFTATLAGAGLARMARAAPNPYAKALLGGAGALFAGAGYLNTAYKLDDLGKKVQGFQQMKQLSGDESRGPQIQVNKPRL